MKDIEQSATKPRFTDSWCYDDIRKLSDDDFWDEIRAHTAKVPSAAQPQSCDTSCDSFDCHCQDRDRRRAWQLDRIFKMIKVRTGGRHGHDI